ncbi:MAG TPA: hypothetical protein VI750_13615 [Pyrinomonadaceae bacterium]|nr:hypothetical protein [Pyrinomonadaceae bacterium]HLE64181.1 hypothetical protein [Pyrinomonadaceae bacterium]
MNDAKRSLLFWGATLLSVLFAAFISIFAMDALEEGPNFWSVVVAFLIHLIPTAAVLLALTIAWRWEAIGAVIFVVLGIVYLVAAWGSVHWSAYAMISGPLFLIGFLFLTDRIASTPFAHAFHR